MSGPTTAAGRDVLDATASDPFIPDTQKAALRDAALRTVLTIEHEAVAAALDIATDHVPSATTDMSDNGVLACSCGWDDDVPKPESWWVHVIAAIDARLEEPR